MTQCRQLRLVSVDVVSGKIGLEKEPQKCEACTPQTSMDQAPTHTHTLTYSRLIPDSGWGDSLGCTMGEGWGIRLSSSISSLEVERKSLNLFGTIWLYSIINLIRVVCK